VRALARGARRQGEPPSLDTFASGAKSLAVIKETKIPTSDGAAIVVEAMRQRYRPAELIDLARELKRRGQDIREGRLSMQTLREQIARGDRLDRLFREDRSGSGGSDRGDRGGRGESWPERLDRPDRSGRSDHPDRVDRSERLGRPERLDRFGGGRDR
jgi:hypothetical protein